jgi:hypothetical protein
MSGPSKRGCSIVSQVCTAAGCAVSADRTSLPYLLATLGGYPVLPAAGAQRQRPTCSRTVDLHGFGNRLSAHPELTFGRT